MFQGLGRPGTTISIGSGRLEPPLALPNLKGLGPERQNYSDADWVSAKKHSSGEGNTRKNKLSEHQIKGWGGEQLCCWIAGQRLAICVVFSRETGVSGQWTRHFTRLGGARVLHPQHPLLRSGVEEEHASPQDLRRVGIAEALPRVSK